MIANPEQPQEARHADSAAFAAAPGESGGGPAVFPKAALLHLYAVAAILFALSLVPYTSDALADYRYWERLDLFGLSSSNASQTAAPAAPTEGAPPAPDNTEEPSAAEVAALAGTATVDTAAALAAGASATEALTVDAEVLGDQKVWLEGDLQWGTPFFQALVDLAQGKRSHVRIGHWGDSHIANDGLTHITRLLLQKRFGDGGHGYTLVQGRTEWYSHKGIERNPSDGLKIYNFLSGNARDGAYGYGGVSVEAGPGDQFTLSNSAKSPATQLIVYYRSLGKAQVSVTIDGKAAAKLQVTSAPGTEGTQTWTVGDGKHAATWRVTSGKIRFHGVAFERDQGIIYDSLGEVGARGLRWTQADAAHLQTVMAERAPDLLILNYGGNERQDNLSESSYIKKMGDVIQRLRGGRSSVACVLFGPSDHGVREKGKIVSDPDVVRIIGWQRKVATANQCLFWDTRAVMGGDGAMGRWVKQGLGWSDYSHFTGAGERVMGQATYRALLQGLDRWRKTAKQ